VPHDKGELTHIERIIEKIPIYEQKVDELALKINALAINAAERGSFFSFHEIEMMIFRAFFIELENRPFKGPNLNGIIKLHANLVHEGIIKNRNVPCEICGENRSIDKCHIIPGKLGGTDSNENLLYLCPTHHRLFDRFMLLREEWSQIHWNKKSAEAERYAEGVILIAHKKFWKLLKNGKYSRIPAYETYCEGPFITDIVKTLLYLIWKDGCINRKKLIKTLGPDVQKLGIKIIRALLKENIIAIEKQGTQDLLSLKDSPDQIGLTTIMEKVYQRL